MAVYIRLNEKERARLFNNVKNNISSSWETFYPKLNISRSMFFNYLSGRNDILQSRFLELKKVAEIEIEGTEIINKQGYVRKEIKIPNMNNQLAEILGVLNGDGHLAPLKYEVCVVGSILEQEYYYYLKKLFEKVFNSEFKVFSFGGTKLKLRSYSKSLLFLLNKEYKLPMGNKLKKLKIPKQVFIKKKWLTSYVRGLFDTDGSVYIRRKKDIVVNISSGNEKFLKEVKGALKLLNFKSSVSQGDLYIYKKDDVKRFFNIIKPANSKHLKRYNQFTNQALLV